MVIGGLSRLRTVGSNWLRMGAKRGPVQMGPDPMGPGPPRGLGPKWAQEVKLSRRSFESPPLSGRPARPLTREPASPPDA